MTARPVQGWASRADPYGEQRAATTDSGGLTPRLTAGGGRGRRDRSGSGTLTASWRKPTGSCPDGGVRTWNRRRDLEAVGGAGGADAVAQVDVRPSERATAALRRRSPWKASDAAADVGGLVTRAVPAPSSVTHRHGHSRTMHRPQVMWWPVR